MNERFRLYGLPHQKSTRYRVPGIRRKRISILVSADREYFEMGIKDLAQAEAEYPGWLARLLTHLIEGLESYQELFDKLTNAKGAIRVYCEVAAL